MGHCHCSRRALQWVGQSLLGTYPIKEVRGVQKADVQAAQVLGCSLPTAVHAHDTGTAMGIAQALPFPASGHFFSNSSAVDTRGLIQTPLVSWRGPKGMGGCTVSCSPEHTAWPLSWGAGGEGERVWQAVPGPCAALGERQPTAHMHESPRRSAALGKCWESVVGQIPDL